MNNTEYLLTQLADECVEVAHDVHKALHFGLHDHNVLNPTGPSNVERICAELNDLMGVIDMCQRKGILPDWSNPTAQGEKRLKVAKFMRYARECGTLQA